MLSINKLCIKALTQANHFSYYIHLKDHNKKINPQKNKVSLSFMNPKTIKTDAPQQQTYAFNLRRKTQKELERKMFEEYKEKVLKGQIDQDEQLEIDALWDEGEKPKHYFQNISKTELMSASHPQNAQFSQNLDSIYQSYFNTTLTQVPTLQQIKGMNPSQLVDAALSARSIQLQNLEYWNSLQKQFGNKFYELSSDELIKLNFALRGLKKKGTPRIHSIISDLLTEQLQSLTASQLLALFYSLRHSKIQGVELQDKILSHLQPLYNQMHFQQKVNCLFTYALARKPQQYKKSQTKFLNQGVIKAHQVIFGLNFSTSLSEQLISVQQCVNIVYSLAKLRVRNTKFITSQILAYLNQNIQAITQNVEASYKLLFYLQELQGGEGINDSEIYSKLIAAVTEANNFASLSRIQQIKTIFAIWNYNMLTDQMFELYKNIQIEADSTLLFYFCQIQLSKSSERQWEVLRCLADLQYIPIPYYQSVKRFYKYMRATAPDWDLTPIEQKLNNTAYYYDSLRLQDQFYNIKVYKDMQKHFRFTQQISPFEHTLPIQNLQVVQFGNATYQVTVDVVSQAAFVPGTDSLKESYRNKIRSLQNMGWKHVFIRQNQLLKMPANQQVAQIIFAYTAYKQEQIGVIANRDYYRAQEIEAMRNQDYWDGMVAEQAEGYRNNPEEYAKKIAELEQKQKRLSEEIAKVQ